MAADFPDEFSVKAYDYELPERLIAQKAAEPRDSSRLLVLHRKERRWEHRIFRDLPEYLDSNDLLVANNTKVLKARLLGTRLREENGTWVPGGRIECVLLEETGPRRWECLFHASAKYNPGLRFEVPTPDGEGLRGTIVRGVKDSAHGTIEVEFDRDPVESGAGEIPLPKYIRAAAAPAPYHEKRYQTIYASKPGSAAAPTAGLHFTEEVMNNLKAKGAAWEEVTLNVGLGTFRAVKAPDLRNHQMHEESYEITPESAGRIVEAKRSGKRVLAVGTTTVRTLESAWDGEKLRTGVGRTSIFIHPGMGHEFQVVDRLLTNFHLPQSTLLMLISAFASRDLVMAAYQEAVRMEYRFFSYGDAMLIL